MQGESYKRLYEPCETILAKDERGDYVLDSFDIRGIDKAGNVCPMDYNELGSEIADRIISYDRVNPRVVIAGDFAENSASLLQILKVPLLEKEINVVSLGLGNTTSMAYLASRIYEADAVAMITTASSEPIWKGIKIEFFPDAESIRLPVDGEQEIRDFKNTYLNYLQHLFGGYPKAKVKVSVEASSYSALAEELCGEIGYEVVDEQTLEESVGLRFKLKGDGDSVDIFDEFGQELIPYEVGALIARDLIHRHRKNYEKNKERYTEQYGEYRIPRIVLEQSHPDALFNVIEEAGGLPVIEKTGRVNIKRQMLKEGAIFGTELSGHYYYGQDYQGAKYYPVVTGENGLFTVLILLRFLGESKGTLREHRHELPRYFTSPELQIEHSIECNKAIIEMIKRSFEPNREWYEISTLDGVKVRSKKTPGAWATVRASQFYPNRLICAFEGRTEQHVQGIKSETLRAIGRVDKDIAESIEQEYSKEVARDPVNYYQEAEKRLKRIGLPRVTFDRTYRLAVFARTGHDRFFEVDLMDHAGPDESLRNDIEDAVRNRGKDSREFKLKGGISFKVEDGKYKVEFEGNNLYLNHEEPNGFRDDFYVDTIEDAKDGWLTLGEKYTYEYSRQDRSSVQIVPKEVFRPRFTGITEIGGVGINIAQSLARYTGKCEAEIVVLGGDRDSVHTEKGTNPIDERFKESFQRFNSENPGVELRLRTIKGNEYGPQNTPIIEVKIGGRPLGRMLWRDKRAQRSISKQEIEDGVRMMFVGGGSTDFQKYDALVLASMATDTDYLEVALNYCEEYRKKNKSGRVLAALTTAMKKSDERYKFVVDMFRRGTANLVVCNMEEALHFLTGTDEEHYISGSEKDRRKTIVLAFSRFTGADVVVTDGQDGAYFCAKDSMTVYHVPANEITIPTGTSGAGDVFTGVFFSEYLSRRNEKDATTRLLQAVILAEISVENMLRVPGPQLEGLAAREAIPDLLIRQWYHTHGKEVLKSEYNIVQDEGDSILELVQESVERFYFVDYDRL